MNMMDHILNYGTSIVLDIQREMFDQKLTPKKPSGGQELKRELLEQQKRSVRKNITWR